MRTMMRSSSDHRAGYQPISSTNEEDAVQLSVKSNHVCYKGLELLCCCFIQDIKLLKRLVITFVWFILIGIMVALLTKFGGYNPQTFQAAPGDLKVIDAGHLGTLFCDKMVVTTNATDIKIYRLNSFPVIDFAHRHCSTFDRNITLRNPESSRQWSIFLTEGSNADINICATRDIKFSIQNSSGLFDYVVNGSICIPNEVQDFSVRLHNGAAVSKFHIESTKTEDYHISVQQQPQINKSEYTTDVFVNFNLNQTTFDVRGKIEEVHTLSQQGTCKVVLPFLGYTVLAVHRHVSTSPYNWVHGTYDCELRSNLFVVLLLCLPLIILFIGMALCIYRIIIKKNLQRDCV